LHVQHDLRWFAALGAGAVILNARSVQSTTCATPSFKWLDRKKVNHLGLVIQVARQHHTVGAQYEHLTSNAPAQVIALSGHFDV
jgi:hypothetical protein